MKAEIIQLGETPQDVVNQEEIIQACCAKWDKSYIHLGKYKYRNDFALHKEKELKSIVEVKQHNQEFFRGMNFAKYLEGIQFAENWGVFFTFVSRWEGVIKYLLIHDGDKLLADPKLQLTGGTPTGRAENRDDRLEPMACWYPPKYDWKEL